MKRIAVSALLIALPACSSAPAEHASFDALDTDYDQQIRIDVSPRDHADLGRCSAQSPGPELVRCGDAASMGNAVTVCGALVAEDAMRVNLGSLVVGGDSRITASIHVGRGSFTSFGGIEGDGTEDIDGDLTTSSNWVIGAPARVGGDAFVGGRIDAREPVRVDGTLHVAGPVSGVVQTGSTTSTSPGGAKSLSCASAPDVQAIADTAEHLGVADEDESLVSVSHPMDATLGCGRYRFASLSVGAPLSLHIDGNVVIVVDGDAALDAPVRIDVRPGGSLDIVIRGSLEVAGALSFDGAAPWFAVGGGVRIATPTALSGWLIAPDGEVVADATLDVKGTLYVGSLTAASPVTVNASATALDACTAQ
jgi:hypothetical protein